MFQSVVELRGICTNRRGNGNMYLARLFAALIAACLVVPAHAQSSDQQKLGLRVIRYSQRVLCLENVSGGYGFGVAYPVFERDMRASPQITYAFALAEPIEREMLAGRDGRVRVFLDRILEVTSPTSSVEFERLMRVCALGRLLLYAARAGDPDVRQAKAVFANEIAAAPDTEALGAVAGQLVTLAAQAGEFGLAIEFANLYAQPRWKAKNRLGPLFYQNAAPGLRLANAQSLIDRLIKERSDRQQGDYLGPIWGITDAYQLLQYLPPGALRSGVLGSGWFEDASMKVIFMRDPELATEVALYVLGEPQASPATRSVMLKAVRLSLNYMEQRIPDRTYAALAGITRMRSTVPQDLRADLLTKYRTSLDFVMANKQLGAALLTSPESIKIAMRGFTDPRGRFLEAGEYATAHFLAEAERFEPLTSFLAARGLAQDQPGSGRDLAAIDDVLMGNPPREEVYWGRLLAATPTQFVSYSTGPAFHKAMGNDAVRPRSADREAMALALSAEKIVGTRTPIPRIDQVSATLLPGEAAISIIVGESYSGIMLFTREGMQSLKINANSARLESLARRINRSLNNKTGQFDHQALTQLSSLVLMPTLTKLPDKRQIYWVADGALASIPPQILLASLSPAEQRYLIMDRAVSVLPSLSSLFWARRIRSATPNVAFLGVGNPRLSGNYDGSLGIRNTLPATMPANDIVKRFGALPGSGEHLEQLGGAFSQPQILTLANANERALAALSRHYGIIAFATHGINAGDTGYIAESGLILTPDAESDGFLRSSEIARGKISGRVVLLTACSSIKGDGMRVNGPLGGLARAFLANGSGSVVGSNWNVPDKPSYAFSQRLVAALSTGATIGQAHRQSVLAAINENSDPRHWAAFSLAGDAQTTIQ
jgi:CHAT domain-containing protein